MPEDATAVPSPHQDTPEDDVCVSAEATHAHKTTDCRFTVNNPNMLAPSAPDWISASASVSCSVANPRGITANLKVCLQKRILTESGRIVWADRKCDDKPFRANELYYMYFNVRRRRNGGSASRVYRTNARFTIRNPWAVNPNATKRKASGRYGISLPCRIL